MPSFLSSLRRKSRANFNISDKQGHAAYTNGDASGQNGNGMSRRKSSSTLNSSAVGSSPSTTPATSTSGEASGQPNGPVHGVPPLPPPRPQRPSTNPTKRYSLNVSGPVHSNQHQLTWTRACRLPALHSFLPTLPRYLRLACFPFLIVHG